MEEDLQDQLGSIDIPEPDRLQFGNQDNFSHTSTVMKAYLKCIDAGAKEMIKGFWETTYDKQGNAHKVYHADTRHEFMNCVETLKNVMIGDFDQDGANAINALYTKMTEIKKQAITDEENWAMAQRITNKNIQHIRGYLNEDYIFYHNYIMDRVEYYRKVWEQIELQLKRLKYLRKKIITG